jgi:hypothetical protein
MDDGGLHEQISQLELRIEELVDATERCRRIAQASKAVIVFGGIWMSAILVGAIRPDAIGLIGATTSIIGGIVLFGSNASTARQTAASIEAAEALRAELIGRVELRLVSDSGRVQD